MEDFMSQPDSLALIGILVLIFLIAFISFIKYDVLGLGGLTKAFTAVSLGSKSLPSEQKDRMDVLLSLVKETGNITLITAWEDLYREYTVLLKGQVVPDIKAYINEQRLITVPCGRKFMDRIWQVLVLLGLMGAVLYPALGLFLRNGVITTQDLILSVSVALLSFVAVIFIVFIIRLSDLSYLEAARRSLWSFQYEVVGWLNPVTEPTIISVLAESQNRQAEAFLEAVDRLGKRLDDFETNTLLPSLSKNFEEAIRQHISPVLNETAAVLSNLTSKVVERQESGMRELATTFANKLTTATANNLTGLAQTTAEVSGSLKNLVVTMEQVVTVMDKNRQSHETSSLESRALLADAGKIQIEVSAAIASSLDSVRKAEAIAAEMREYTVKGIDKADAMAHQSLQLLEGNLAQVKSVQNGIKDLAYTLQRHSDNSIAKVSEELAGAIEKYTGISQDIEAARKLHGEEMDAKIGLMIELLDKRLTNYSNQMIESNAKIVNKLTSAVTEVSQGNGILLDKINKQASQLYTELAGKMDHSNNQISGYLVQAIKEYTRVSAKVEETREQYGKEMNIRVEKLISEIDKRLSHYTEKVFLSNTQTSDKLTMVVKDVSMEGNKILEKASSHATNLYSDLLNRLDKSIDAMGDNLAASMRAAMGESVEIVEKLAVRTSEMKDLYDSYFTRIGEQSTKTLDDLDFSMQKVLASFSNETTQIIGKLTNNSSGALELFDKGIKDLVENMEEHSRNMGLYAKEINIDVADLSTNLRESVQEFSTKIQEGIYNTFQDFDKGLGEVTLRLATILESIKDSAEALQRAMKH